MQTIDDIRYDGNLYTRASSWTLLLYQQNGVSIPIHLPDANLMSFIRVHDDITQCQNHIGGNLGKMITLFVSEENMVDWLRNNIAVPHNLLDIKIFCQPDEQLFVRAWARRYTHRLRNTSLEIINLDTLNYKLLLFGVDHLKRLHSDFRPRSRSRRWPRRNYKCICRALANHFWQEANN